MAAPIPTTEPTTLIAGDTARWAKSLSDHLPADGWTLAYTWLSASTRYTATAAQDPDDASRHLLTITATTTAAWSPGMYEWRARVSHTSGDVITVASGTMQVTPSFATATDARSHAAKALANIEAYLENSSNLAAAEYSIAGRQLKRHSIPGLLALRDKYRAEVMRENATRTGGHPPGRIFVRFGA